MISWLSVLLTILITKQWTTQRLVCENEQTNERGLKQGISSVRSCYWVVPSNWFICDGHITRSQLWFQYSPYASVMLKLGASSAQTVRMDFMLLWCYICEMKQCVTAFSNTLLWLVQATLWLCLALRTTSGRLVYLFIIGTRTEYLLVNPAVGGYTQDTTREQQVILAQWLAS